MSCADEAQCSAAYYCRLGDKTCQPAQANGQACSRGAECASTNCVDGVCCDSLCEGECVACSTAKKGGGADGACGAVASDTDPDNECDSAAPSSCGHSGACSGTGACAFFAAGTPCGVTSCSNGSQTGKACDGAGICQDAQTSSCAPYFCGGSSCATSCLQDTDCIASYWCRLTDHTCQPDQDNGASCTSAGECKSGYCIDGFCCDTGCQDACMACSASKKGQGTDGICAPIANHTDPDNECEDKGATSCVENGFCSGSGGAGQPGTGGASAGDGGEVSPPPAAPAGADEGAGCGCSAPGASSRRPVGLGLLLAAALLVWSRRGWRLPTRLRQRR